MNFIKNSLESLKFAILDQVKTSVVRTRGKIFAAYKKNIIGDRQKKYSILLIHGFLDDSSIFSLLAPKLTEIGYRYYFVDEQIKLNTERVPLLADKIWAFILDQNLQDVIILAHSKGGLIGKYIMAKLDLDKRVAGMVAVCTPFSGTSLARFVEIPSVRELDINSDLLTDLGRQTEVDDRIVSVYLKRDEAVWNKAGCFLKSAKENIEFDGKGHHFLLTSNVGIELLLKLIGKLSREN